MHKLNSKMDDYKMMIMAIFYYSERGDSKCKIRHIGW